MEEALPELPRPRKPAAALARVKVAPALLLYTEVRYSNMGKEHYIRSRAVDLAVACAETSGSRYGTPVSRCHGISYPRLAIALP